MSSLQLRGEPLGDPGQPIPPPIAVRTPRAGEGKRNRTEAVPPDASAPLAVVSS